MSAPEADARHTYGAQSRTWLFWLALALAACAWLWRRGGSPPAGEAVWLAGFVLLCLIRFPHARATRANVIRDDRVDAAEKLLLVGMFLASMTLPLLYLATPLLDRLDYALPRGTWLAGLALQASATWLFWRSHADLGRNWSPSLQVREDHGLVTRGVYARIRHPMYAAIWLGALAQPLLLHNWVAGALVVPAFAAMYVHRAPREEAMMRARFGADYDAYCARTCRLVPRLRRVR